MEKRKKTNSTFDIKNLLSASYTKARIQENHPLEQGLKRPAGFNTKS